MNFPKQTKYVKRTLILVAIVLVIIFISQVNIAVLKEHFDKIGFHFFGIFLISIITYALSALGWLYCINEVINLKRFNLYFIVRQIGESVSIINPTGVVAGDALKVALLTSKNENKAESIQSVTISRLLVWVAFLLVLILTLLGLSTMNARSWIVILTLCIVAFVLAAILVNTIFNKKLFIYSAINRLAKILKWQRLSHQLKGIRQFNKRTSLLWKFRPYNVIMAIIMFSLHYLTGGIEFYYILWCLDSSISLPSAIYLEIATSMVRGLVSFVPGQIGFDEYSTKFFLDQIHIDDENTWITVATIRRMRQVIWMIFSFLFYFIFFEKKK